MAFDMLYCVAFEMMDAHWLAMRASYMEFNVNISPLLYIYGGMQTAMSQSDLLEVCEIILDFTTANLICSRWMYLELEYQV